jgi:hypothetical protein
MHTRPPKESIEGLDDVDSHTRVLLLRVTPVGKRATRVMGTANMFRIAEGSELYSEL